jgi:hypothetical protein
VFWGAVTSIQKYPAFVSLLRVRSAFSIKVYGYKNTTRANGSWHLSEIKLHILSAQCIPISPNPNHFAKLPAISPN